jgi:hypothetical protein
MKAALAVFVVLFAASSGASAEPADPAQPSASPQKQAGKRTAPAPAKPKGEPATTPGGMPQSFVIPSNTCEQGTPLQRLLTDKPKK